jgi:transcription antitermination protein NusB
MGARRAAREQALQALYQLDVRGDEDGSRALALFWEHFDRGDEAAPFARALVEGVQRDRERIDALIAESAEHWRLPRLSRVDLGVLRIATYELLHHREIPVSVTLNEAVEIARRFGSEESASFVNGVLDHVAQALGRKEAPASAE